MGIHLQSNHTTNKTTHDLLGNWRGIRIDQAFVQGEYDFLFTKDGLTVSGKANATASTKSFASTAGDKQLWLTFTAGPDKGMVRKAIYSSGPDGPETKKLTIAMGAAAPSTAAAVAPASFDAAMMSGASSPSRNCACSRHYFSCLRTSRHSETLNL